MRSWPYEADDEHDDIDDEHDDIDGAEVPMAIGEFEGGRDFADQEVRFELRAFQFQRGSK